MEIIISLVKSYSILMLLLLVMSHLAPKDSYKKYFQFFIGAWMCVLLLKPVLAWMGKGFTVEWEGRQQIEKQIGQMEEWQEDGGDIFELFYMAGTENEGEKEEKR